MYRGKDYAGYKFFYFPKASPRHEWYQPKGKLFMDLNDSSDSSDFENGNVPYPTGSPRQSGSNSFGLVSGSPKQAKLQQNPPKKRMFYDAFESDSSDFDIPMPSFLQKRRKSPAKNGSQGSTNTVVEIHDFDIVESDDEDTEDLKVIEFSKTEEEDKIDISDDSIALPEQNKDKNGNVSKLIPLDDDDDSLEDINKEKRIELVDDDSLDDLPPPNQKNDENDKITNISDDDDDSINDLNPLQENNENFEKESKNINPLDDDDDDSIDIINTPENEKGDDAQKINPIEDDDDSIDIVDPATKTDEDQKQGDNVNQDILDEEEEEQFEPEQIPENGAEEEEDANKNEEEDELDLSPTKTREVTHNKFTFTVDRPKRAPVRKSLPPIDFKKLEFKNTELFVEDEVLFL